MKTGIKLSKQKAAQPGNTKVDTKIIFHVSNSDEVFEFSFNVPCCVGLFSAVILKTEYKTDPKT